MNRPQTHEYPPSFKGYIDLVDGDLISLLTYQAEDFSNFIAVLPNGDLSYAPGKWTVKELVGHVIDTERIMAFRLLAIARGEQSVLPGFDEDSYVKNSNFKQRTLSSLAQEFTTVRKANLFLIAALNEEELNRVGNANGNRISVRALVFMMAGHVIHHQNVIKERYL